MSKYRSFTLDELIGMEEEFVRFLIVNGISSEEWEVIKNEDQEQTKVVLSSFSDVVWESILRRTNYLDLYEKRSILAFYCGEKAISFRGIKTEDPTYDFTKSASIERSKTSPPADLIAIQSERLYNRPREEEIYDLILRGAQPSDGKLFHSLS